MVRRRIIIIIALVVAAFVVAVALFFFGDEHAVSSMSIKQVTPDQLAAAMKEDHFYSDYRQNTLLIRGEVASVSGSLLTFKTSSSYQAQCSLAISSRNIHKGDNITVISEGGTAARQPNGVLLKDCVIP